MHHWNLRRRVENEVEALFEKIMSKKLFKPAERHKLNEHNKQIKLNLWQEILLKIQRNIS